MEIRHLRYFIAVAEELHFGRAAQRLHIAQPPLSQQIKQLEDELGIQLFERTKRHVYLTEAGQVFLAESYQVLERIEQAITVVQQASRGERGTLSLGFVGSATTELLPRLLRELQHHLPHVELRLREMTTSQQIRALQDGRLHVGIVRPPVQAKDITLTPLLKEPLLLALPEDHPLIGQERIEIAQLSEEAFILFPRQQGPGLYDQIISLCQQSSFSPHVAQEAVQMQTILGLVAGGLGIALIPQSAHHLRSTGVVYRPISPATVEVELALVWHQGNTSPLLPRFLRLAQSLHP